MARYNPQPLESYPIGWFTAARQAAELRPKGELDAITLAQRGYVACTWAPGEAGAVARMKRLRAFRQALEEAYATGHALQPELRRAFAEGWELTFRKEWLNGAWEVQVAWKPKTGHLTELARGAEAK